jgi:long-chain acyl-CoA synthetase
VSQALVIGDRRPYVTALLTLEPGVDPAEAEKKVQELVDDVNHDLSRYEQIKRFAVLPRDFAIEEGELTPTLKLKRRTCEQHFAAEIDALYA